MRSSSSVDLDSLRSTTTERACHRPVCWVELATSQAAAVRRTPQLAAAVEDVLFWSTSSTTVGSRMVSAHSAQPGGDQENPSTGRSRTRRSPTSKLFLPPRPPLPPQPLHSLKTSPAAARQNAAKSRSTPSCATGSSTCWTCGRENGDGACSVACVRCNDFAPGCLTGSTLTPRSAGNGAHQEQRRWAGRLCCHPQTRLDHASTPCE